MPPQHHTPDTASSVRHFLAPAVREDPFGIYVHFPFCRHICPYCDFNTYSGQEARIPAYIEAVRRDIYGWSSRFEGRKAGSIFIGGGTPSLLSADQAGAIVGACRAAFSVSSDAEITIEANPNDLTASSCAGYLNAGVNRISIGAQTFDHRGLRVLGRLHTGEQIGEAVAAAREAGFENISLDFIYGWPGQTLARWERDLDQVLSGIAGDAPPHHLSLYGLIVEPGTPMADAVARGILTPVDEDQAADFYELAEAKLATHGWLHYEIANWSATPELASRHNALYWRNGEYAGIGAGAHGHAGGMRILNQPSPRRYVDLLANDESPATNVETIDERTAKAETMMLGLRLLREGVSRAAFLERHGTSLDDAFGVTIARLASLELLDVDASRVRLTSRGALLANSVCAEFL